MKERSLMPPKPTDSVGRLWARDLKLGWADYLREAGTEVHMHQEGEHLSRCRATWRARTGPTAYVDAPTRLVLDLLPLACSDCEQALRDTMYGTPADRARIALTLVHDANALDLESVTPARVQRVLSRLLRNRPGLLDDISRSGPEQAVVLHKVEAAIARLQADGARLTRQVLENVRAEYQRAGVTTLEEDSVLVLYAPGTLRPARLTATGSAVLDRFAICDGALVAPRFAAAHIIAALTTGHRSPLGVQVARCEDVELARVAAEVALAGAQVMDIGDAMAAAKAVLAG